MIKYLIMLLLIPTICYATDSDKEFKPEPDGNYDKYYYNIPKMKDCQTIRIDESFLNEGKKKKNLKFKQKDRTICFWEVEINKKNIIMWTQPGTDKYGFINFNSN